MPSRKSNISTVTNGDDETPAPTRQSRESLGVEDLNLPRTMIQRLSKGVLPANTQIQKDALLALSKSATVFVNFLASNASEYASINGKKTIMPQDVFAALKDHEFDAFIPRVTAEVAKYNEMQCDKRNSYRRKIKAEKAVADPPSADGDAMDDTTISAVSGEHSMINGRSRNGETEPPSKKLRREAGDDVDDEDEDVEDGIDEEADDIPEDDEDGEEEDAVEGEDEVDEDEEAGEDKMQEDGMDDDRVRGGMQDEALDDDGDQSD